MTSNAQLLMHLDGITNKDNAAFRGFYNALEKPLYGFLLRKLNDPHRSADILHDVFLEVWRNAGAFQGRSTVKTWVFGIAHNKAVDFIRRETRVSLYGDDVPEEVDENAPNGERCLLAAQEAAHVKACVDELKAAQRSVVELVFFEDMSYGEIAEVIDVPEGTVKTRVFHAKKQLLCCLQGRLGKSGVTK